MNLALKKFLVPIGAVLALLLMIAWMAGMFHAKVAPGVLPAATQPGVPAGAFTVESSEVAATEAVPATIGARQPLPFHRASSHASPAFWCAPGTRSARTTVTGLSALISNGCPRPNSACWPAMRV
jgi:hypothetical protein